jgi:hypothetical protein
VFYLNVFYAQTHVVLKQNRALRYLKQNNRVNFVFGLLNTFSNLGLCFQSHVFERKVSLCAVCVLKRPNFLTR